MATLKPTPKGSVRAVNAKGTTTFFSQLAWSLIKEDQNGWRNGWKEVKDGEQPDEVLSKSNIPPELMSPEQREKLTPSFTPEEKNAMIAEQVKQGIEAGLPDAMAEAMQKHEDEISTLKSQHESELSSAKEEADSKIESAVADYKAAEGDKIREELKVSLEPEVRESLKAVMLGENPEVKKLADFLNTLKKGEPAPNETAADVAIRLLANFAKK